MGLIGSTGIKQAIQYFLFSKVECLKKKLNNMFHCRQDDKMDVL